MTGAGFLHPQGRCGRDALVLAPPAGHGLWAQAAPSGPFLFSSQDRRTSGSRRRATLSSAAPNFRLDSKSGAVEVGPAGGSPRAVVRCAQQSRVPDGHAPASRRGLLVAGMPR